MDIKNIKLGSPVVSCPQVAPNESTQNLNASTNVYEANFGKYVIVPLGCECIARDIFVGKNQHHVKPLRDIIDRCSPQSPFDGCIHASVDGIIRTLDTDFKEYFNDLGTIDVNQDPRLTVNFRQDFQTRRVMFFNKTLKAAYVHDDCGERKILEQKYKKRIDDLRESIKSGKHVLFSIACLGHSRHDESQHLLNSHSCLITSDQIKRLSIVLDKICARMHSLVVFAPGADISSNRKDVLILKEHFGDKGYWGMMFSEKVSEYYKGTFEKIKKFFENRMQETALSERNVQVDV